MPIIKGVKFLATNPRLQNRRKQAFITAFAASFFLIAPFALIPVPYVTVTEGVIWLPEQANVRSATDGIVKTLLTEPDVNVTKGDPLILLDDPTLHSQQKILELERHELSLRLNEVRLIDRVQADMIREQIKHTDASLKLQQQRTEALIIRAPETGRFAIANAGDLPGQFIQRGELLAYVIGQSDPIVRVVINQDDVDLIRSRTRNIQIRFVETFDTILPATLQREVPAASEELPSRSLSTIGGGSQELDPSASTALKTLSSVFEFDLQINRTLLSNMPTNAVGGRAYVRFDHGKETIIWQVLRALRQLFLRTFNV